MYRIAICDDDQLYVEELSELLKNTKGFTEEFQILKYYSGEEFIQNLSLEYDLVILDMQMDDISGISAALKFRSRDQDAVLVFCTGVQLPRPEFFDVQPFRYLMKSYSKQKMKAELECIIHKTIENKKQFYMIVRTDGGLQKILLKDITYISILKHGCCVHIYDHKTKESREIHGNQKLKDVYEELKGKDFEYAHNSYIINFQAIVQIQCENVVLEDLVTLNISRSKRQEFHKRFADYLGGKYKRESHGRRRISYI